MTCFGAKLANLWAGEGVVNNAASNGKSLQVPAHTNDFDYGQD